VFVCVVSCVGCGMMNCGLRTANCGLWTTLYSLNETVSEDGCVTTDEPVRTLTNCKFIWSTKAVAFIELEHSSTVSFTTFNRRQLMTRKSHLVAGEIKDVSLQQHGLERTAGGHVGTCPQPRVIAFEFPSTIRCDPCTGSSSATRHFENAVGNK